MDYIRLANGVKQSSSEAITTKLTVVSLVCSSTIRSYIFAQCSFCLTNGTPIRGTWELVKSITFLFIWNYINFGHCRSVLSYNNAHTTCIHARTHIQPDPHSHPHLTTKLNKELYTTNFVTWLILLLNNSRNRKILLIWESTIFF